MRFPTLLCAALAVVLGGSPRSGTAQEDVYATRARADSLYFAGDPEASWDLLTADTAGGPWTSEHRWRAIRASVALGMLPETGAARNQWLERGVRLAEEAKSPGPPTVDELWWGAAAEGRLALRAAAKQASEMATRARDDARLLLLVDSLHGGAHDVIGRVGLEVQSLPRAKRIMARLAGVRLPSDTDWESAEYHLRRATELWPYMVLFHLDLAKLLIARDRDGEAREALEAALATPALHPPDASLKHEARVLLERLESRAGAGGA